MDLICQKSYKGIRMSKDSNDVEFQNYPWYVSTILMSVIIIEVFIGSFLAYQLHWIIMFSYLGILLSMLVVYILYACRQCFYWGQKCPSLLGYMVSKIKIIKRSTNDKTINRLKTQRISFLFLWLIPFISTIIYSGLYYNSGTNIWWTNIILLVFLTIICFIIFPRIQKQSACAYCFNKNLCFENVAVS